jgi:hypothetical protein
MRAAAGRERSGACHTHTHTRATSVRAALARAVSTPTVSRSSAPAPKQRWSYRARSCACSCALARQRRQAEAAQAAALRRNRVARAQYLRRRGRARLTHPRRLRRQRLARRRALRRRARRGTLHRLPTRPAAAGGEQARRATSADMRATCARTHMCPCVRPASLAQRARGGDARDELPLAGGFAANVVDGQPHAHACRKTTPLICPMALRNNGLHAPPLLATHENSRNRCAEVASDSRGFALPPS